MLGKYNPLQRAAVLKGASPNVLQSLRQRDFSQRETSPKSVGADRLNAVGDVDFFQLCTTAEVIGKEVCRFGQFCSPELRASAENADAGAVNAVGENGAFQRFAFEERPGAYAFQRHGEAESRKRRTVRERLVADVLHAVG